MFDHPIIFLIYNEWIIVSAVDGYDSMAHKILEDCGISEKEKMSIDKELILKSYLNDPKYCDIVTLIVSNYG